MHSRADQSTGEWCFVEEAERQSEIHTAGDVLPHSLNALLIRDQPAAERLREQGLEASLIGFRRHPVGARSEATEARGVCASSCEL